MMASYFHFYARIAGHDGACALLTDRAEMDTAIVFVHGFGGDPTKTWLNFQALVDCSTINPQLWSRSDLYYYRYSSVLQHIYQNGELLLDFLEVIFPKPAATTLTMARDTVRDGRFYQGTPKPVEPPRSYSELVLVGHSEGGLIIRNAVLTAAKRMGDAQLDRVKSSSATSIVRAHVRLFAPALLGARISGPLGSLFEGFEFRKIASLSRAYSDMTSEAKLDEVKSGTEKYAEKWPSLQGFRARVLWGEKDSIVTPGEFSVDVPDRPAWGRNHETVCKPTHDYLRPLEFVSAP